MDVFFFLQVCSVRFQEVGTLYAVLNGWNKQKNDIRIPALEIVSF